MIEIKEPTNEIINIQENDKKKFNKYEICFGIFFLGGLLFLAINAFSELNLLP